MDCENQTPSPRSLPARPLGYQAGEVVGWTLVNNEAVSSTLRMWREGNAYQHLLERTQDGPTALDAAADYGPIRAGGEHLQREIDGVIARWKAEHPEVPRAC